jgi:hypothetical protein
MVVGCLAVLALVLPRGGKVNPLLRSDRAQSVFMTVWVAVFLWGAALALFGAPAGITLAKP